MGRFRLIETIAKLVTNKKNGQSTLTLKKGDCDFLRNKKKPIAIKIKIEELFWGQEKW